MKQNALDEESLEIATMNKLEKELGYDCFNGLEEKFGEDSTFGRDTTEEIVLIKNLKSSIDKLNPNIPADGKLRAIEILRKDRRIQTPINANKELYKFIKDGITVTFKDKNGIDKDDVVKVIDFNDPFENDFLAVRQFKISGDRYHCRADMVIFINGLPLVFVELKSSYKNIENAYNDNIRHYKTSIPQVFWHNAFIIISNGSETKLGTFTSGYKHYSDWKKINSNGDMGGYFS
ncbi:MAG: Type-1 restriction enzyme R protein [Alphaproteobacteria bacterium ADurb.Bin438]|nr:MAG: Type-1 restriction enzyme R protein [Alphaproteobacteria bacterium ADurb.Bin438]